MAGSRALRVFAATFSAFSNRRNGSRGTLNAVRRRASRFSLTLVGPVMMRQILCVAIAGLSLSACGTVWKDYSHTQVEDTPVMLTDANVRIITQRKNPQGKGPDVFCSEPSPDVAKALSTALELSANVAGRGEGKLGYATAEQFAAWWYRSAFRLLWRPVGFGQIQTKFQ